MGGSVKVISGLLSAGAKKGPVMTKGGVKAPVETVERAQKLHFKYFADHDKQYVAKKIMEPVQNMYQKNLKSAHSSLEQNLAKKRSVEEHNGDFIRSAYHATNHDWHHKLHTHPEFVHNITPITFREYTTSAKIALISTVIRDITKDTARDNMTANRETLDNRNKELYGDTLSPPAYQHIVDIIMQNPDASDEEICQKVTHKALLKTSPVFDSKFGLDYHPLIPSLGTEEKGITMDDITDTPDFSPKL